MRVPLFIVFFAMLGPLNAQEEREIQQDIARNRVKEQQVLSQLNELDQKLHGVNQELEGLRGRAQAMDRERRLHEDDLSAAESALDEQVDDLRGRLLALYRMSRWGFARMLFSSDSPAMVRRRARYLTALLRESRSKSQNYVDEVKLRRAALSQLEEDRTALNALQGEVRLKESALRDERARRAIFMEKLHTEKDLALQALEELDEAGRALGSQVQGYAEEAPPDETVLFRSMGGNMIWPVRGTLLRRFGGYTDTRTGQEIKNNGIDIEAREYTPFRAVAGGAVKYTGFIAGFGLTVLIQHGAYSSVYSHASKLNVSQGQRVDAGDVLGLVGETGLTDGGGPRLHFEIRYEETAQDPLLWLEG